MPMLRRPPASRRPRARDQLVVHGQCDRAPTPRRPARTTARRRAASSAPGERGLGPGRTRPGSRPPSPPGRRPSRRRGPPRPAGGRAAPPRRTAAVPRARAWPPMTPTVGTPSMNSSSASVTESSWIARSRVTNASCWSSASRDQWYARASGVGVVAVLGQPVVQLARLVERRAVRVDRRVRVGREHQGAVRRAGGRRAPRGSGRRARPGPRRRCGPAGRPRDP